MPIVFISYRRNDSAAVAGRLYDRLSQCFGPENIFLDIEGIPIGDDFPSSIHNAIRNSSFLLVLIGPRWHEGDSAWYERFLRGEDWVRIEIEAAIELEVPIIPIMVDGAKMLPAELLPESIRELAYLNALNLISGPDFNDQLARILRRLSGILPSVVQAFSDRAERQSDAKEQPPSASSLYALKSLYEALVDCHEAYLRYAHDLCEVPQRDRRFMLLSQRPQYVSAVRSLAQVVWKNRATLEIFAPEVLEALVTYADTETGFLGDEVAISRISKKLTLGAIDARAGVNPFYDARELLAEFIRKNSDMNSFVHAGNRNA